MNGLSRRGLLQGAGALAAGTTLRRLQSKLGIAPPDGTIPQVPNWVRSIRLLIAEGYSPPFYPALDYDPKKAVAIARELGSRNITCNAVAPGFIETAMTEVLGEEFKQNAGKQIPLGRVGSVEDVANAVAFLASDEASYITGHVLAVNGGMLMG